MEQFKFGPGGLAVTQKLISFDNMEREGYRELVPLRESKFKEMNLQFRCYKNKEGEWAGIPVGLHPDGTHKFRLITIRFPRIYNLENIQDAQEYHIVKSHPKAEKSINQDGMPMFKVYSEEAESKDIVDRIILSKRAIEVVSSLQYTALIDFGRLFGIDPAHNKPMVIQRKLLETAQKTPRAIIEKWKDTAIREIEVVIERGIATGLIKYDMQRGGYFYKDGIPLGNSKGGVVEYFRKDNVLLTNVDRESKGLDKIYNKELENEKASQKKDETPGGDATLAGSLTSKPEMVASSASSQPRGLNTRKGS